MKLGHTKDKCWELHGRPTWGRGGRSNFNRFYGHFSKTSWNPGNSSQDGDIANIGL